MVIEKNLSAAVQFVKTHDLNDYYVALGSDSNTVFFKEKSPLERVWLFRKIIRCLYPEFVYTQSALQKVSLKMLSHIESHRPAEGAMIAKAIDRFTVNRLSNNKVHQTFLKLYPKSTAVELGATPLERIRAIRDAAIANQDGYVAFYKSGPTESYGNFASCPEGVRVFSERFVCAEAAFQYKKCQEAGVPEAELQGFFKATGEQAFRLSRSLENKHYSIWKTNLSNIGWFTGYRDEIMKKVVIAKYAQNSSLLKLLQASRGTYLIEHNSAAGKDDHWSDNGNGTGANMLGRMLMAIRDNSSFPRAGSAPSENEQIRIATYAAQFNGSKRPYPIW